MKHVTATAKTATAEKLWSTEDLAEFLNLSEACIERDRSIRSLGIPFIKVGDRLVRYDPHQVRVWCENHTVSA